MRRTFRWICPFGVAYLGFSVELSGRIIQSTRPYATLASLLSWKNERPAPKHTIGWGSRNRTYDGRVKICCLAAWRYPMINAPARIRTQLYLSDCTSRQICTPDIPQGQIGFYLDSTRNPLLTQRHRPSGLSLLWVVNAPGCTFRARLRVRLCLCSANRGSYPRHRQQPIPRP